MKYGTINCSCGQQFYFETMADKINCIACKKEYGISSYPEKVEEPIIEEVPEELPEIEGE